MQPAGFPLEPGRRGASATILPFQPPRRKASPLLDRIISPESGSAAASFGTILRHPDRSLPRVTQPRPASAASVSFRHSGMGHFDTVCVSFIHSILSTTLRLRSFGARRLHPQVIRAPGTDLHPLCHPVLLYPEVPERQGPGIRTYSNYRYHRYIYPIVALCGKTAILFRFSGSNTAIFGTHPALILVSAEKGSQARRRPASPWGTASRTGSRQEPTDDPWRVFV